MYDSDACDIFRAIENQCSPDLTYSKNKFSTREILIVLYLKLVYLQAQAEFHLVVI